MIRWHRAVALAAATACAAAVAVVGAGTSVVADDSGLVVAGEWSLPKDTIEHGFVAVDDVARVGYAFSNNATNAVFSRVQAIDLDTGKPRSAVTPTRRIPTRAPVLVDTRRHVVIYAETHPTSHTGPLDSHLVGITLRGKEVKEVFRVPSPLGLLRIAGMSFDDAGDDLVLLGTADGAGQNAASGSSLVQLQRVSIDGLMAGKAVRRWTNPVQLDPGVCQTPLQTLQPAGVLVSRESAWIGCRGGSNFVQGTNGQNVTGASTLILRIDGLGTKPVPATSHRVYRTPGNFTLGGESVGDDRTRRFAVIESSGYIGLRVFDTDHSRWVGRVNAGSYTLYGVTVDPRTSRAYFISQDAKVGIGYGDLAALVPTQGERLTTPYSALIGRGIQRRISFDSVKRRLFVPLRRLDEQGVEVESVMVLRDKSEPYVAPDRVDHARGTIDAVDREGVTESSITSVARAYGVDYQLIGGTANLFQNWVGPDARGQARPGSRHVRAAYVKSATLTGDLALGYATTAEEDATTDQDRHGLTAPSPAPSDATAGSSFAPVAECSDYGVAKTRTAVPGAVVECDLKTETVRGEALFQGDDAVLITVPQSRQQAPVRAPVQVGRAWTEVKEQRGAKRGALVTTVTTTAENVTIHDVVRVGRVTHTVVATAHGRTGTAKVERTATISDVTVNGQSLCGSACDMKVVQREVNRALNGRGGIDFPPAEVVVDPRGTYAELRQDPWYHAERVLDYDKANDDYVVPVMSVQVWLDSTAKSRLVVDVAGLSAAASYRVFPLGSDDYDGGDDGGSDDGGGGDSLPDVVPTAVPTLVPAPGTSPAAPAPAPAVASGSQDGLVNTVVDRLSLSLRTLGEAIPLLLIWALLAVPTYLAARRRLLLELPMLTRDEELTT